MTLRTYTDDELINIVLMDNSATERERELAMRLGLAIDEVEDYRKEEGHIAPMAKPRYVGDARK
jgi:hypothetical protein